jgi:peptidoglycan/LPS O-acetylase OafA/YrhL
MPSWNPQYKTLDHWRGVAALWVMIFHGFGTVYNKPLHPLVELVKSVAAPSWLAVHLFFVISGYLITKILINDFASRRFSFVEFYERRARRIFPALVFTGVCTAITAWIILNPSE